MAAPIYYTTDGRPGLRTVLLAAEVLSPSFVETVLEWHPAGAGEPLVLALADLFRPI